VLSPLDLLPESEYRFQYHIRRSDELSPLISYCCPDSAGVLGIVGFLDDVFILLIVFMHLAAVYRSLLVYRHGGAVLIDVPRFPRFQEEWLFSVLYSATPVS
jgi:hypothetical protein